MTRRLDRPALSTSRLAWLRQLDPSAWVLLAISCLMFGAALVCVGIRLVYPSDGARLAPGAIGAWQPDGILVVPADEVNASSSPLHAGDKVTAVDGVPIAAIADGLFMGAAVPPLEFGQTRVYSVVRDGRAQRVAIEPRAYTLRIVLAQSWGALVSTLALLFIAGVAFAQRPNHPLIQALMLMSLSGWGIVVYSVGLQVPDLYDPPRFWLLLAFMVSGILLYMVGLLRVSLALAPPPTRLFGVLNRPGAIALTVALPMGIALLYLLVQLQPGQNTLTWLAVWIPTFATVSGAVIFAAIVLLALSYAGNPDRETRRKVRLVVGGGLVSAAILLIANAIPVLVLGRPLLDVNLLSLGALPVTIAMGIAIFRYHLVDIDFVVSRTLVYAALTAAMLATYFVILAVLLLLLGPAMSAGLGQLLSVLAIFFTLGIGIVLFNPLRERFQLEVDRRFFRSRYVARQLFTQFASAVRNQVDVDKLKGDLVAVIEDAMQPTMAAVREHSEDGASGDAARAATLRRELSALAVHSEVIDLADPIVVTPELAQARADGVRLVAPLLSQGRLVGVIELGERRNGQPYSLDDRRLLGMLAAQVASPLHTAQLARAQQAAAVERERIDQELTVARRIQHALLPTEIPRRAGYTLRTFYEPARAVGGDLYDFVELPGDRLGIFVGDVSDKGIPAAMVMSAARSVLRSQARTLDSPGAMLQQANALLFPDMPPGMFVTCFCAVVDPATGEMRFANAGHDLPHLTRGGEVREVRARGMPLGLLPDSLYEEDAIHMQAGDAVLFASDGIAEAHNAARVMFGADRLGQSLRSHVGAADLIERVLADLRAFVGPGWVQEDDITLVLVRRDPA